MGRLNHNTYRWGCVYGRTQRYKISSKGNSLLSMSEVGVLKYLGWQGPLK
ncbi:MAG: hypothetical protein NTY42_12430 [Planctomycetota bacterium]|nr:hypothetical protein [Planctomycetota bacterium]